MYWKQKKNRIYLKLALQIQETQSILARIIEKKNARKVAQD